LIHNRSSEVLTKQDVSSLFPTWRPCDISRRHRINCSPYSATASQYDTCTISVKGFF
jgi:hypothetical protein